MMKIENGIRGRNMNRQSSRLFVPYKALGLVCSEVAPVLRLWAKGKSSSILCAVGNVVNHYSAHNLRLVSISDTLPANITLLAADHLHVYAAVGSRVALLHLTRQVKCWFEETEGDRITGMLPFGHHLITVTHNGHLSVWDVDAEERYTEMTFDTNQFSVTALCHPATYLDKILLGSVQGPMKLINIKTGKIIHEFTGFQSSVTVLQQSPAADVLAIGLADGRIVLHNIYYDESLFTFSQELSVTSVAFRTDGGPEWMISAGTDGTLAVWDLNKRRLAGQMTDVHSSSITGAMCVHGEPLMVTAGTDNALKTWIFDLPDGMGRQLVVREGHSAAATTVRFHGAEGEWVLSASRDGNVRAFSVRRDSKQQNLGTAGTMNRAKAKRQHRDLEQIRLPAVTGLDSGLTREAVWDNIVCVHEKSPVATTWTSRRQRLGSHRLMHKRFDCDLRLRNSVATCVCVSACGNFTFLGYSSGHLDAFNVQSGKHRGTFKDPAVPDEQNRSARAHAAALTGICSDILNATVASSCAGGRIKFWSFKLKRLLRSLDVGCSVDRLVLNRDNDLAGVSLQNGSVGILDIQCRRVVRRFNSAHKSPVSALDFSADGNWLLSADFLGFLKVWDLATASLIDVLRFDNPCIGMSFGATNEYLATVHENQRAIYIWVNRLVYEPFLSFKSLALDFEPELSASLPRSRCVRGEGQQIDEDDDSGEIVKTEEDVEMIDDSAKHAKSEIIVADTISLSGLPTPRWAYLPQMDEIRERTKPKEPAKKPQNAPFFLPTVSTFDGFEFDRSGKDGAGEGDNNSGSSSRLIAVKKSALENRTKFGQNITEAESEESRGECFEQLKGMGPAATDMEIRALSGGSRVNFLKMLAEVLKGKRDYDLANAYLATFVKHHRESLWSKTDNDDTDEDEKVVAILSELSELVTTSWNEVDQLFLECLGLVQWLKSAAI